MQSNKENILDINFTVQFYTCKVFIYQFLYFSTRAVPIIGSAKISATDMAIFTNIDIGTEQYEDRYQQ